MSELDNGFALTNAVQSISKTPLIDGVMTVTRLGHILNDASTLQHRVPNTVDGGLVDLQLVVGSEKGPCEW